MRKNLAQGSPSKGIEWLARFGYAAKGVVYVVIGVLTLMSVLHMGGHTTSTKGAVSTIGSEPFGEILLIAMAAGLIGYVVWRFTQALKDPEHRGRSVGGVLKRLGLLGSGLIYASLALYTIQLLIGSGGSSSGGHSKDSITARIMSHQGGVWVIAAIGVLIIIIAIMQFVRAYRRGFEKRWSVATMGITQRRWAGRIAQWGLSARGVVFLIMGGFLIVGAWQTDPSKATGLDGALKTLAQQSYGVVLLAIVALGLICYGVYCWVNAVHRRINP